MTSTLSGELNVIQYLNIPIWLLLLHQRLWTPPNLNASVKVLPGRYRHSVPAHVDIPISSKVTFQKVSPLSMTCSQHHQWKRVSEYNNVDIGKLAARRVCPLRVPPM